MTSDFKFFKSDDSFDYSFIKTPKALFYDEACIKLSPHARLLYIAMLERQSLSLKNNWKDKEGNVYIIFTHENAKQILSCADMKCTKTFAELEGAALIKRKRRGLGKPDIIYINLSLFATETTEIVDKVDASVETSKTETAEFQKSKFLNFKNESSRVSKSESPELLKEQANNININNIKNNYINPSIILPEMQNWNDERESIKEFIKQNIEYNSLKDNISIQILDEIVSAITDTLMSKKAFLTINGEVVPSFEVKTRFQNLDQFHIEYVCDILKKNKSSIRNMRPYLLTCLYRASDNISLHYQNMVNHDMAYAK